MLLAMSLIGSSVLLQTGVADVRAVADSAVVSPAWMSDAQRHVARREYDITLCRDDPRAGSKTVRVERRPAEVFQAPNRAQGFRTTFDAEGIRVIPRIAPSGEAPAWEWRLSLVEWGRDGEMRSAERCASRAATGNRIEYVRDGIKEWYVNDERGLEQGFVIESAGADTTADSHSEAQALAVASPLRLEMAVGGNIVARVTDEGRATEFMVDVGTGVIRFDALHAFDSTGRELPSHFEVCDEAGGRAGCGDGARSQRLTIVVDDTGAVYPVTIDPLATFADWAATGQQFNADLGRSVATAGDVNGDGFSDVIIAAPDYDDGQTDEGRVFVYYGSASGLIGTLPWHADGNQASARFGSSVCTAGDVNGDGFSDVIIGIPEYDGGVTDEGRVVVYHGSASGLSTTPNWTIEGNVPLLEFGSAVAAAGDVNGDGFGDVIIGAPRYANGQEDEGRAFVYHGSALGLGAAPAWTAEGNQAGALFGHAVAAAGDVNGDGFGDVIVGAPVYANGQEAEGRAFVYHGSALGLGAAPAWTAESNQFDARFGAAVAGAGDVNGDGFSDVIVGAAVYDNGQTNEGRAFVYHGAVTGLSTSPNWTAESDHLHFLFAYSVSTAGDVNGDGFADVIIGAPANSLGPGHAGQAFLYEGSASGLSTAPDWNAEGSQLFAAFGYSVSTAGDVNGDGLSDVIVGQPYYDAIDLQEGRAAVYHGTPSGLTSVFAWSFQSNQVGAQAGIAVSAAGDVNGDGFGDVIIGAWMYDNGQTDEGRAIVYHGSETGLAPSAAWFAESNQAGAQFGFSVSAAGDVNGDGYGDVIVGAPGYDNGQTNEGRVYVYHGSPSGLALTPAWTGESNQAGAQMGFSVSEAGDVNGDGFGDVVVGAVGFDGGETDEGRAFVFHGTASGLSSSSPWSAEGNQVGANFGTSVSTAGDVNGDGFSDVIVGANRYDHGETDEGGVFVYHGSASGLAATPAWTAESNQASSQFGASVSTAGDMNGDGYSDVLVGAFMYDQGETNEGRAFAYRGSASGLAGDLWYDTGDQVEARFGSSVSSAGDVNGDGRSDVIIGAYLYDGGQTDEGRAFLFAGTAGGAPPMWTAESDQANAQFGFSVSAAGDVNGDGFGDVIVGAYLYDNGETDEGRVFVYYGCDGGGRTRWPRQQRTDVITPIAPLGRSDSETRFRILGTMLSPGGRTRVAMQHEVKPLGVPFDGTGLFEGSLVDTGSDGAIVINRLVQDLVPGTAYHWRVRPRFDAAKSPFQPHGPWLHMPFNGWNEADLRTAGTAPRPPCPADLNGDELVDGNDLTIVLGAWGACASCAADINGDHVVDGNDLTIVLGAWGACR